MPGDGKEGRRQARQPGQGEQEQDAGDHGQPQPQLALLAPAAPGQLPGQDGDEDDVVDPEDDLERGERHERDPGVRLPAAQRVHPTRSIPVPPRTSAEARPSSKSPARARRYVAPRPWPVRLGAQYARPERPTPSTPRRRKGQR